MIALVLFACADKAGLGDSTAPTDSASEVATWYRDADGDGWGQQDTTADSETRPEGYTEVAGDCDDGDDKVHPAAVEICEDGVDNDCTGGDAHCSLSGDIAISAGDVKLLGPGEEIDKYFGYRLSAAPDLNGDGAGDLIIEGVISNIVSLVPDGVHPANQSAHTWSPGVDDGVGTPRWIGDVSGDGVDDCAAYLLEDERAFAGVYLGPLSGVLDEPDFQLVREDDGATCTGALPIGDVMGDGVSDVGLGCSIDGQDGNAIALVHGPITGDAGLGAALFIRSAKASNIGGRGTHGRDINGDGAADLIVSDPQEYSAQHYVKNYPGVFVIHGPVTSDLTVAGDDESLGDEDLRLLGTDGSGLRPATDADIDGDGSLDLVAGEPYSGLGQNHGTIYIVPATTIGRHAFDDVATARIEGEDPESRLGAHFDVGDVDADGYGDIALGFLDDSYTGSAYLFYGPLTGTLLPSDSDASFLEASEGDLVAEVAIGDFNGDTYDDIAISAQRDDEGGEDAGAVYLFWGGGLSR